jgi:hypothetical protein
LSICAAPTVGAREGPERLNADAGLKASASIAATAIVPIERTARLRTDIGFLSKIAAAPIEAWPK